MYVIVPLFVRLLIFCIDILAIAMLYCLLHSLMIGLQETVFLPSPIKMRTSLFITMVLFEDVAYLIAWKLYYEEDNAAIS